MDDLKCPGRHVLPHSTEWGECTPMRCAASGKNKKLKAEKAGSTAQRLAREIKQVSQAELEKMNLEDDAENIALDAAKGMSKHLSAAAGRLSARRAFSKVPENLSGAEAEEFFQRKMVDLLPMAAAEIEYQLTMGDDKQRIEAARDVMDANGVRKRDSTAGTGATIILNLGTNQLPWMQRVEKTVETKKEISTDEKAVLPDVSSSLGTGG